MRDQHPECLDDYIKNKKNIVTAYESLLRILRRLAYRHGFVQRTPSGLKEKLRDMIAAMLKELWLKESPPGREMNEEDC
ncbi:hypothetical protein PC116_g17892 [Phytophthora cactorum]|nr:hypothetical protein PC116_g17892 [Phytophthora cactorum]